MKKNSTNQKIIAGVALLVIVAIAFVGDFLTGSKSNSSAAMVASRSTNSTSSKTSSTTKTCSGISNATTFKDGIYNATGSYTSPGGVEDIKVSLTLSSGTITAATAASGANDPTASSYQSYFIGGFKQQVLGKKITTVKLTNVSGSSLTSQGFNKALQSIECSAKEA
jgi:uncharacterized protein with FMN-binding domain